MKLEDIYMIFFSMMKIYISGDEDASVGVGGVDDGDDDGKKSSIKYALFIKR